MKGRSLRCGGPSTMQLMVLYTHQSIIILAH